MGASWQICEGLVSVCFVTVTEKPQSNLQKKTHTHNALFLLAVLRTKGVQGQGVTAGEILIASQSKTKMPYFMSPLLESPSYIWARAPPL